MLPQADAELEGIRSAGGDATLFQVAETLPQEVLEKMHAPPKPTDVKVLENPADLEAFDGILFGIPTRYGNFPAQFKAFWDKTGGQWAQGSFWGKYAGLFISTGTQGGGQESTAIASMSTLAHHGFIYVPLGYKTTFCKPILPIPSSNIGTNTCVQPCSPTSTRSTAAPPGALVLSPQATARASPASSSSTSRLPRARPSTRP